MAKRRTRFALSLMVVAIAVTGCASDTDVALTPSPTASAAASSPAPSLPGPTLPVVAFDGDCANVLDLTTAESLLGGAVSTSTFERDPRTAALGVLECEWMSDRIDANGHRPNIQIASFPLAVVDDATRVTYAAPMCEQDYDVALCKVAVATDDQWILVTTGAIDYEMTEPVPTYLEDAAALVATSAANSTPPHPYKPGVPSATLDCTALGERIDVAQIVGPTAQFGFPTGGVNAGTPEQVGISAGVYQWCAWTVYDTQDALPYVWYDIYRFAGWMWDDIANHAGGPVEEIDVPGATRAVLSEDGWVAATDGTVVITLSGDEGVDLRDAAARMLAALVP